LRESDAPVEGCRFGFPVFRYSGPVTGTFGLGLALSREFNVDSVSTSFLFFEAVQRRDLEPS